MMLAVASRFRPSLIRHGVALARYCSSSASGKPFLLSDIGEGIAEVEILQWFVKPGDSVDQFDQLCEVQSDKATVEITSPFVGKIVSLSYETGEVAKTGTPLLHWLAAGGEEAAADAPAAAPAAATPAATSTNTSAPASPKVATGGKVLAAPAARGLAKQHGIDLATVLGTGRDGRVTKEDILKFVNGGGAAAAAPAAAPAAPATPAAAPAAASPAAAPLAPPPRVVTGGERKDTREPIRGIRKAMFAQMTASLAVPRFAYCDEARMDALIAARMELKAAAAKYGVAKFTLMPLLIKATSVSAPYAAIAAMTAFAITCERQTCMGFTPAR